MLNYSKVREVEKELATLQFQLKLTSGPKRSALEMFRKKIEAQNACVLAARERHRAAKKVSTVLAPQACREAPAVR